MREMIDKVLRVGSLVVIGAVVLMPDVAGADDDEATAKAAYEEGKGLFEEEKYEEAIVKFTDAYNLTAEPNLLFNLATCAEKLGDLDRAAAYYEVYLEEMPDAPDAEQVRKRVALLRSGEFRPPKEAEPKEEAPPPKEAPKKAPPKEVTPAKPQPQKAASAKEFYEKALDKEKREPFWPQLTIGLGGMVIAGGVITGVLAQKKYKALKVTCKPDCTDDDIAPARGLAIATDVQLGLGIAAAAAGVVGFVLLKKKAREKAEDNPKEGPAAALGVVPGALVVQGRF